MFYGASPRAWGFKVRRSTASHCLIASCIGLPWQRCLPSYKARGVPEARVLSFPFGSCDRFRPVCCLTTLSLFTLPSLHAPLLDAATRLTN
ncbi:hypothetical protein P171DRAFT_136731 [Karstenula rhodostoma CBS 690.94]|uniref:Uncharacterized protein n=1 Tax=Karstenula rhodostoma CBS 690.94 TaxID=1392251 RepID=A0A9P4UH39_9PLEO|nr:hypothetical protein P171DRAFT_136731 [Karstenula rhodostoma CBS 690.94]